MKHLGEKTNLDYSWHQTESHLVSNQSEKFITIQYGSNGHGLGASVNACGKLLIRISLVREQAIIAGFRKQASTVELGSNPG